MADDLLTNQHHEDVTRDSVRAALLTFLDQWERGGCDDCGPSILDEALEDIETEVEYAQAMRRIGVELAQTGQNMLDNMGDSARIDALERENERLRGLYDNLRGFAEKGWTIDHLMECEEALRCAEARVAQLEGANASDAKRGPSDG